jgi:hypothetical protein
MTAFKPFDFRLSLIALLSFFFSNADAQVYNYADGEGPTPPDSIRGLYVGLNLGVYFANKNTAFVYDGSGYTRDGATITDFNATWLNQAIQGTIIAQNRTSIAMGGIPSDEWEFTESDMPQLMTFSGSFMYGGHLRYMFNSDFGVFLELNGTNPVTVGQFTIINTNQAVSNDPGQSGIQTFGIRGEEQRLLINLGMHRVMLRKAMEQKGNYNPTVLPYFDAGMNMTFTKFQANFIDMGPEVGNVDLMTQVLDNSGFNQLDANVLTGVGVGGFAAIGGQITIGRKFTIDIGYVASFETIKLGEVKKLGLQNQIVLKAIYM